MAASRSKKIPSAVRCFEVYEPTLHEKGFTVYKVSQKIILVDAPEEDVKELVTWKRYNDFKKLHQAMLKLHLALHRKEEFPPFSRATVFGRFEENVIIDRMRSAQDLLNFVGQRDYMVNSKNFKDFFEGSEVVTAKPGVEMLQPKRLYEISSETPTESDSDSVLSGEQDTPSIEITDAPESTEALNGTTCELGGVWQYRQTGDDISLNDDGDDDVDASSSSLPTTDSQIFDPLKDGERTSGSFSNTWLLSELVKDEQAEDEIFEDNSEAFSEAKLQIDETDSTQQTPMFTLGENTDASDEKPRSRTSTLVESGKGDLTTSPLEFTPSHNIDQTQAITNALAANGSPKKIPRNSSLLNLDISDKGDYILQAAKQISLAQHCESSNNFHLAFNYYKNGVGILLTGVQIDENETRREVVRRKTAKYLMKAEQLHNSHLLHKGEGSESRWDTGQLSPAKELEPSVAMLQGSFKELTNFKVLGIIDTVMLVIDKNTDNTFVIKVLHKTSSQSPTHALRRCLVHSKCPYMIELYRFYDAHNAIYLMLQHASGGTLWNYVSHFLQTSSDDVAEHLEGVFNDPHERKLRTYSKDKDTLPEYKPDGVDQSKKEPGVMDISENDCTLAEEDVIEIDTCSITPDGVRFNAHDNAHDNSILSSDKSQEVQDRRLSELSASFIDCDISADNLPDVPQSPGSANVNAFQNLLQETTRSQNLAGFSVDSFDSSSDTETLSRQLSNTTTERIDSIIEEPTEDDSVLKDTQGEAQDEVFKGECEKEAPAEEVSIYDAYKTTASSSSSEGHSSPVKNHGVENSSEKQEDKQVENVPEDAKSDSDNEEEPDQDQANQTPEKQQLDDWRPRKRTLSSVFNELDLAEEKENATKAHLPEACIKQWIAEVIIAVDNLHKVGIICKDLKPANILLGDRGHILLTHFSYWSSVDHSVDPQAVERLYTAPEVLAGASRSALNPSCDWWSIGVLLYELLTGQSLVASHPSGITSHTQLSLPDHLSAEAGSLLRHLLRTDAGERLGAGVGGCDDIKLHPFFSGIDWGTLERNS